MQRLDVFGEGFAPGVGDAADGAGHLAPEALFDLDESCPGEFVQLTRAVVILEALIRGLAPGHDYMQSFRAQYARLTAKSLSATRVGSKTGKVPKAASPTSPKVFRCR